MNIALVAHDGRKRELLDWVRYNIVELLKHNLYATGTTGQLIKNEINKFIRENFTEYKFYNEFEISIDNFCDIKVNCLLSGPLGGDSQIGTMIAEGNLDVLIFFCDNLITQGHQQDVGALSRLASLYNIAYASNRTTADMILTSSLFNNEDYKRIIPDVIGKYANRKLD